MGNHTSNAKDSGTEIVIEFPLYTFRGTAPNQKYEYWKTETITVPSDATLIDVREAIKKKIKYDKPDIEFQLSGKFEHEDTDTARTVFIERAETIRVNRPRPHWGDIGIFANHGDAPGSQFLISPPSLPTKQDLDRLVDFLQGDSRSSYQYADCVPGLDQEKLMNVKNYVEQCYESTRQLGNVTADELEDFKVNLTKEKLVDLIGEIATKGLLDIFMERYDDIIIRRCSSYGKHINFHVDFACKTLQVAINGDDFYVGGRLAYVVDGQIVTPNRPAGSVVIHNGTSVHGVTEIQSGVRYGLFLLQKTDAQGKRGNAWLSQSK